MCLPTTQLEHKCTFDQLIRASTKFGQMPKTARAAKNNAPKNNTLKLFSLN